MTLIHIRTELSTPIIRIRENKDQMCNKVYVKPLTNALAH